MQRLAGAPISWGVCEVPGWGLELPPDRVLGEMRQLGLTATELGSVGYLPTEPDDLRAVVERHDLRLVGGFVPVVIHDPAEEQATIDAVHRAARLIAGAGGTMFVSSAVTDWGWGPRQPLDSSAWRRGAKMLGVIDEIVGEYGMMQALHPHLRTIVETRDDMMRILDASDVGWTLDTGHMLIGGLDPQDFLRDAIDRVRHVHLKDVHLELAAPVFAGEQEIMEGVQAGMFCNLGDGDAPIGATVRHLEDAGYDGWYVLEQDAAITTGEPAAGSGPVLDVQASIDFLRGLEATVSAP